MNRLKKNKFTFPITAMTPRNGPNKRKEKENKNSMLFFIESIKFSQANSLKI